MKAEDSGSKDELLATIKHALAIADALELHRVAVHLDEARFAMEGPETDETVLRRLGLDMIE